MIDFGLLVTMIVAMGLPTFVARWWALTTFDGPVGFLDAAIGPAFAGLSVGRLVAVGIDGPGSLGSLSDLLIVRSGVEFWPGVAAAALFAAWVAQRASVPSIVRIVDLSDRGEWAVVVAAVRSIGSIWLPTSGVFSPANTRRRSSSWSPPQSGSSYWGSGPAEAAAQLPATTRAGTAHHPWAGPRFSLRTVARSLATRVSGPTAQQIPPRARQTPRGRDDRKDSS